MERCGKTKTYSNGDARSSAADTGFAKFKVMMTGADGSRSVQSRAALVNIETKLTEDATRVVLADGSAVQGQSSFGMNGVARTVASAMLMAEELGHRVVVNTGYGADGKVALSVKSVTSATELCVVNSFDLEGKKEWIKTLQ